jgi:hypothetical protein
MRYPDVDVPPTAAEVAETAVAGFVSDVLRHSPRGIAASGGSRADERSAPNAARGERLGSNEKAIDG